MKWKAVIVILVVLLGGYLLFKGANKGPSSGTPSGQNVSANPDDIAKSLDQQSQSEVAAASAETADSTVVTSDSQALGDLGQSFNENSF